MIEFVCAESVAYLKTLPDCSVDAVLTDPPYPEVVRPYGKWTVQEWETLMDGIVTESRRILKPTGSALFVLQPNSETVGSMRAWLWKFMAKWYESWNCPQDIWWWNPSSPPTVHCQRTRGLMRPSVKALVWLGGSDCYRDQDAILWSQSEAMKAEDREDRALRNLPSGQTIRRARIGKTVDERGGVTPFNLFPVSNTNSSCSSGSKGHGAGTPLPLCRQLVKYLCPVGGLVVDPFNGAGTFGIACHMEGRNYLGIEKEPEYVRISEDWLKEVKEPKSD